MINSIDFRVVPSPTTRINTCSIGKPINCRVGLIAAMLYFTIHDIYKIWIMEIEAKVSFFFLDFISSSDYIHQKYYIRTSLTYGKWYRTVDNAVTV